MTTNSITLPETQAELAWSNHSAFLDIMKYQTGWWWDVQESEQLKFASLLQQHAQWNWRNTRGAVISKIGTMNKVVDVGSGVGILDMTMHQINTGTEFYLVDKDGIDIKQPFEFYSSTPSYYNSWAVVNDLLTTSPTMNPDKFHTLDTVDPWPTDVDLVMSRQSWCFCYPKELYWAQTLTSLKIGGTLLVDVINRPDRNVVEEISEELGATAQCHEQHKLPIGHPWANELTVTDDNVYGGYYSWVRQR